MFRHNRCLLAMLAIASLNGCSKSRNPVSPMAVVGQEPSWVRMYEPQSPLAGLARIGNLMLASHEDRGIVRSENAGASWSTTNILDGTACCFASKSDLLFAGTRRAGVLKGGRFGTYWDATGGGLPDGAVVQHLASNDRCLLAAVAGVYELGLYRSPNAGLSWSRVTSLPERSFIVDLAAQNGRLFASLNYQGSQLNGVFRSVDNGETWALAELGLPKGFVRSFGVDRARLYAATDYGLYLSTDGGDSWGEIQTPAQFVDRVAARGSRIVIVDDRGKSWRSSDDGASWARAGDFGDRAFTLFGAGEEFFAGSTSGIWKLSF